MNECASSENNCNRNALCINTAGGFRCTCKQGFVGNGIICTAGKKYMYVVSAISLYIKLKIIMPAAEDHIMLDDFTKGSCVIKIHSMP